MKNLLALSIVLFALGACGTSKKVETAAVEPQPQESEPVIQQGGGRMHYQTDVRATMQRIFDIAKEGDVAKLEQLAGLCNENIESDNDVRTICQIGTAEPATQNEFFGMFRDGEITGDPRIEGDYASVPFKFGPKGQHSEVMNLQRVDGKWYLVSF